MSALAEKLRAARRSVVVVAGHEYTVRRPTDAEAAQLAQATGLELVQRFVEGWNHTELSLGVPGGSGAPAEFSAELWREWVADNPQVWGALSDAIMAAYSAHIEQKADAVKN